MDRDRSQGKGFGRVLAVVETVTRTRRWCVAGILPVIDLPADSRNVLKGLAKAELDAAKAAKRAAALRRQASQRLRRRLGISIREVGDLMGVSGSRAQQLLGK